MRDVIMRDSGIRSDSIDAGGCLIHSAFSLIARLTAKFTLYIFEQTVLDMRYVFLSYKSIFDTSNAKSLYIHTMCTQYACIFLNSDIQYFRYLGIYEFLRKNKRKQTLRLLIRDLISVFIDWCICIQSCARVCDIWYNV